MVNQDERGIQTTSSKEKILLVAALSVFCINLSVIAAILILRATMFGDKTIEPCSPPELDNSTTNSGLVLYFHFNNEARFDENNSFICDFSGRGNTGQVDGAVWNSRGGIWGGGAYEFSKPRDSIRVKDSDSLSPSTFGQHFSVSYWIKFGRTAFIGEGSGHDYLNYLGKGSFDEGYEWLFRQYNSSNSENRNNRISFYAFNPAGGLGAGSFFQDTLTPDEWMYLTGVINGTHIKLYKNGVLQGSNPLSEYTIRMNNTKAALYIGNSGGNLGENTAFIGTIDELRIYNRSLSDSQVGELYNSSILGGGNNGVL